MQSIILKGSDGRIKPLSMKNLLSKTQNQTVTGTDEDCETKIEVLKVGDEIRGVEVRCSCGETTVIELTYPSA